MKIPDKRNHAVAGKPMTKKEFVRFVKESEKSWTIGFDKGIEIIEQRLKKYRNMKD